MVLAEVKPWILEVIQDMVNEDNIEVFATKMCVIIGRLDLEYTFLHLKHGDIEGTTTEIIDGNNWWVSMIKTVCQSSGCRLIDDMEDIKTSNLTCIFGGLLLSIIEVHQDCDNGAAE